MIQNVIERVIWEIQGIEKRKETLGEALQKEEKNDLECRNCGKKGAVKFQLDRIIANNLEVRLRGDKVILCHKCIRSLLNDPTSDYKTIVEKTPPTKEREKPLKEKEPIGIEEKSQWKKPAKKKREELLEMSSGQIGKKYGISKGYASVVKRAIQEGCFEVLMDTNLSKSEQAEALDVKEGTISLYLTALEKVGINIE